MKKSDRIVWIIACCFVAVFTVSLARAGVVAQVDRTRLAVDETLTLTISKDGSSFFSAPDFSPLEKDFTLLGQSQSSSTQIVNGSATSSARWLVGLAPKRTGQLVIPALTVGKEQTEPINIQIDHAVPPKTTTEGAALFLETDLDRQEVFVQSQLVFTLRIFWAVDAQVNDPGDLVLEDALIRKLGDATFSKQVDGRMYKVFERKIAIFPQKSGTLEIPSIPVDAIVPISRRQNSYFDPFANRGKAVKLRSKSKTIKVLEKPPGYPAQTAWLPADSLKVKVDWSHDPQDLKVGESITFSIITTAEGLMAAQLPTIVVDEVEKIKLYQNKAEEKDGNGAAGVVGVRTETIALIPTSPGEIELPEIRIPWWDKQQQKVRYAVAPATRLVIHGGSASAMAAMTTPAVPESHSPVAAVDEDIVQLPFPVRSNRLFWPLLCGGMGLAWLITTFLLLRTRKRLAGLQDAGEHGQLPGDTRKMSEDGLFRQFIRACRANDLARARADLLVWAKEFWPTENIRSMADLERLIPDAELAKMVGEMDRILYGRQEQSGPWDGARLAARIEKVRAGRARAGKKKTKTGLPQLYKNFR